VVDYVTKGHIVEQEDTVLEKEIAGLGTFVSSFVHSLDPKRRLTIPSEWRAQVGSPRSLYVLPDVNLKCLRVFPSGEMTRILNKMRQHSIADAKARQFARILGSQSDLVSWDTQGRIRIKDALLNFAGITDQVEMVGTFDTFEIWNPKTLKESGGIGKVNQEDLRDAARYVGF
jgi:MraZ protein